MKNTVKIMGLRMMALGLAVMVSACGAMSKMKVSEQSERSVELEERLVVNEDLRLGSRWWSGQWAASDGWMLVLMESDSAIVFDPQDGFAMQGGRVLYQQWDRESSANLSVGGESLELRRDSLSESAIQEEESGSATVIDKERKGTTGWLWSLPMLVGAIGISLLVLGRFKWS